jgi:16S rRNA (guanine1516-N2)-methyltransferase
LVYDSGLSTTAHRHINMSHQEKIVIQTTEPELDKQAITLAQQLAIPYRKVGDDIDSTLLLKLSPEYLALFLTGPDAPGAVWVDFAGGSAAHRRKFGGGRGQPIAKAAGLKSGHNPTIVDATAGLGRDAFVLASLGCQLTLVEQSPVIAALLADGLKRAALDPETQPICEHMLLVNEDAASYLERKATANSDRPEVVYLDPMYPHREKSALVKKEMRLFQLLLGSDNNNEALLAAALKCALKRVVVKRPKGAEPLPGPTPTMAISSKNTRFDVYVMAAMGS